MGMGMGMGGMGGMGMGGMGMGGAGGFDPNAMAMMYSNMMKGGMGMLFSPLIVISCLLEIHLFFVAMECEDARESMMGESILLEK